MGTKSQVIRTQNELTEFIEKANKKYNLSREQIRYLLTDKLNDMSKTDMYWGKDKEPIPWSKDVNP